MDIPQQLANGIFLGSIYALFALGYTLVLGVLDILNLAHAAVFMLGGFIGLVVVLDLGLPIWVALVAAFVGAGLVGVLLERIAFRPLARRAESNFAGLISSLAMGSLFVAVVLQLFGPNVQRFPPETIPDTVFVLAGARIQLIQVIVIGVSVALMAWLTWVVERTRFGRALRAVADSPRAAAALGIDVNRVYAQTFFLSSALGGVAGVLFGLAFNSVASDIGLSVELKGIAAIIVGGMGSLPGAMVGGLVIGLSEVFAVAIIGSTWRDAVAFGILFAILLIRPQGLFGRSGLRGD